VIVVIASSDQLAGLEALSSTLRCVMEMDIAKRKYVNAGMFRPLRKQRFSDQIADLIQKKILEDKLAIGTNLPSEKEMAGEFQVSRSVIREALRILEISGLVNIKKGPTGGIF
jgi:DNA-binding MarR family transcriptional regulator